MILHTPQIIYIVISLLSSGIIIANHGKPKTGKYDGWATVIVDVFTFALLYWGGFFG